jgi:uncharacterized membrane protein YdjX (TVP38/TMEM64 family)
MSHRWSWLVLAAITLVLILGPFFLFEESMNQWAEHLTSSSRRGVNIAGAVVMLLALDVVLPVPSSIVSTASGAALGMVPGAIASAVGMTAGSLIGYALGARYGLPLVRRMVGQRDVDRVSVRFQRNAGWALALMRPIPVLAEASALFAGVARVPLSVYIAVTTLANAGISTVYAAVGANAFDTNSFLLAFAASIGLPAIAMSLNRWVSSRGV